MKNSPEQDRGLVRPLHHTPAARRRAAATAPLLLSLLALACSAPERKFEELQGAAGSPSGGAASHDPSRGSSGGSDTGSAGSDTGSAGSAGSDGDGDTTDTCDRGTPPACFSSVGELCAAGVRQCTAQGEWGACDLLGLSNDFEHCGDGCNSCDPDRADACSEGLCACGSGAACGPDELCCDDGEGVGCVAPLDDPRNCGGCGHVCTADAADERPACVDGACTTLCIASNARCDGSTLLRCGADGAWTAEEECALGCRDGACLKKDGQPCGKAAECASGSCNVFYADGDKDGYHGTATSLCGTSPPSGYTTTSTDCCDTDPRAYPGQPSFFSTKRTGCGGFDFDCNGTETKQYTGTTTGCGSSESCGRGTNAWRSEVPACGENGSWSTSCSQSGAQWCPSHSESRAQGCR